MSVFHRERTRLLNKNLSLVGTLDQDIRIYSKLYIPPHLVKEKYMNYLLFSLALSGCDHDSSSCFIGTTLIWTENGMVAVSEITVGTKVWSYDTKTGKRHLRTVTHCLTATATSIGTLSTANARIKGVTREHPFYKPEKKEWVEV